MNPIAIALSLSSLFAAFLPHPHVPKAIVAHGAGGTATLTWFTVPYNKEQVKTLPNGADWHLGVAMLDVAIPLKAGDVAIPPAQYKLDVHRDDKGEFTEFVLSPVELRRASQGRRGQPADPEKVAAVKKDLAARGIPESIRLPAKPFPDDEAEHLEFMLMTKGYEAVQQRSSDPKGGASFTLMATFGDLHRKVDLVEQFTPKDAPKDK